jgi:outer membrane protein
MKLSSLVLVAAALSGATGLSAQENAQRLALPEAVQRALKQNRAIKVESYSRDIARAYLLAAQGRFDPAMTFERYYVEDGAPASSNPLVRRLTQTDTYGLSLDGETSWGLNYSLGSEAFNQRGTSNGFTDNYSTFTGLTLTQPLLRGFGFGANLYEVRVARADRSISEWEFRQTITDTITRVVIAYSDLLVAHEYLRVTRRSRDLAAGLLTENEKRFKAGGMSENQLVQARARTAARAEAILFAERGVRDADNELRELIGETAFSLDGPLLGVSPVELADVDLKLGEDLKTAYALRPDYQSARLGLMKREANYAYARNQLMPRLDVVGSYGYSGLDHDFSTSRRMMADREHRSYSAGVVVSVPLTFARERGRVRAARLEQKQAEAELGRMEQEIALNVTAAAGQIETVRQRVKATRMAFDLASHALEDELKKLRAGASTTFVVLSLQESLSSVELAMYRALAEQQRAIALYDRELGRTLERHGIALDGAGS